MLHNNDLLITLSFIDKDNNYKKITYKGQSVAKVQFIKEYLEKNCGCKLSQVVVQPKK